MNRRSKTPKLARPNKEFDLYDDDYIYTDNHKARSQSPNNKFKTPKLDLTKVLERRQAEFANQPQLFANDKNSQKNQSQSTIANKKTPLLTLNKSTKSLKEIEQVLTQTKKKPDLTSSVYKQPEVKKDRTPEKQNDKLPNKTSSAKNLTYSKLAADKSKKETEK